MTSDGPEERIEDVFIEVAAQFVMHDFMKFARSSRGLCLDENEIDEITQNNREASERKMKMLFRWRMHAGTQGTCRGIRETVARYRGKDGDVSRDGNATKHRNGGHPHIREPLEAALPGSSAATNTSNFSGAEFANGDSEPGGKRMRKDGPDDFVLLPASLKLYLNQVLSRGNNTVVYKGEQINAAGPRPVAIKSLPFDEKNLREAKMLQKLSAHQNVVFIIHSDFYFQGDFRYNYLALELFGRKNLYDVVTENFKNGSFDPVLSLSYAKQLAAGLHHIHENEVLHRDLKPHNILVSDDGNTLKIADFGLSKPLLNDRSKTKQSNIGAGTEGYMAPETLNGGEVSKATDVFSLGLLLFFVWSNGKHPFGEEPDLWNFNIKKGEQPCLDGLLINEEILKWAKMLLGKMLQFVPENRPTIYDILDGWSGLRDAPVEEDETQDEEMETNQEGEEMESPMESTPIVKKPCIGMFDVDSHQLVAYDPSRSEIGKIYLDELQFLITELTRQTCSAVTIGDTVYGISWRRFLYWSTPSSKYFGWRRTGTMREGHGRRPPAVVMDDCIYVCGGGWKNGGRCYKEHWDLRPVTPCGEKFNPRTKTWTPIPDMKTPRRKNALATTDGCIYSIGGRDEASNFLDSVEKFDPQKNEWSEVEPLNIARSRAAAVGFGGKIYVMGGVKRNSDGSKETLKAVECYDPKTKKWTMLAEMTVARSCFKACIIGEKMYAVGGDVQTKQTIEVFSFKKKEWKKIVELEDTNIQPMATVVLEC